MHLSAQSRACPLTSSRDMPLPSHHVPWVSHPFAGAWGVGGLKDMTHEHISAHPVRTRAHPRASVRRRATCLFRQLPTAASRAMRIGGAGCALARAPWWCKRVPYLPGVGEISPKRSWQRTLTGPEAADSLSRPPLLPPLGMTSRVAVGWVLVWGQWGISVNPLYSLGKSQPDWHTPLARARPRQAPATADRHTPAARAHPCGTFGCIHDMSHLSLL